MLKKNNKILIGSLVFLLVLSVGYALFSDTITINGTASAKGNFDYELTCTPGISEELYSSDIDYSSYGKYNGNAWISTTLSNIETEFPEVGYSNDLCEVNGNNVSFSTNLKGPGSTRYFTVKLTNTGSIPIKVGTETATTTVGATVTSVDNTTVNLTNSDFSNQIRYAWVAGKAIDIQDLASGVAQEDDSMYMLIILKYPEKLIMNRSDIGVCELGQADASCYVPGNGRTKKVNLSINHTLNIPIQQETVN